tara:strand:- start:2309 stop:2494 length:186 start_codon:yes stop_codon:yes gene_type:complete
MLKDSNSVKEMTRMNLETKLNLTILLKRILQKRKREKMTATKRTTRRRERRRQEPKLRLKH